MLSWLSPMNSASSKNTTASPVRFTTYRNRINIFGNPVNQNQNRRKKRGGAGRDGTGRRTGAGRSNRLHTYNSDGVCFVVIVRFVTAVHIWFESRLLPHYSSLLHGTRDQHQYNKGVRKIRTRQHTINLAYKISLGG